MSKPYSGGCACGAIRYEISAEPLVSNECQCRDCQRRSGTGHGSYLTFPRRVDVKLTGEARLWEIAGDSGNVKTHGFCPTCGSPVYLTFAAMPDLFTVHAASLDDPSVFKPQMVTYGIRGYAWDHIDPALPKFDRMPPCEMWGDLASYAAGGAPSRRRSSAGFDAICSCDWHKSLTAPT